MTEGALHPGPTGLTSERHSSPTEADAFDCFNEDLVWILDKLVSRAGGAFGLLSGHLLSERESSVLALTTARPELSDAFVSALAAHALGATDLHHRRRGDDGPVMLQGKWAADPTEPAPVRLRTLQLCFWPTQNVSLVATICKAEADGAFGVFDELTARKLYPVLSRYVRLWWMHRLERRRANSLSAALDLSDVGVLLLSRRGELVFANTRAAILLQDRDGICRHEKSVLAERAADGFALQAAVQHAIHCNLRHSLGDSSGGQAPILQLGRRDRRRPLIATVMHVERTAVDPQDPAVIVYVLDPEQNVELLLNPVCGLYGLTSAETRLVIHLVSGLRLADAAEKMQIQSGTARAYLKQVFSKTMTHRQADLVRVMLSSVTRTHAKADLAPF